MSFMPFSDYLSLTKVKNPDDISIKILWSKELKPPYFKDSLSFILNPSIESLEFLQPKPIPDSVYKKLLEAIPQLPQGIEEHKDEEKDSYDEGEDGGVDDENASNPSALKGKDTTKKNNKATKTTAVAKAGEASNTGKKPPV